jgi:hypothetical protein
MRDRLIISKPHVVIVEGTDEERFFGEFFLRNSIENIQIINSKGVQNIRTTFQQICLTPQFISHDIQSLSIIRDADSDPQSSVESISTIFSNSGIRGNIVHNSFTICSYPNSSTTVFCGFFIVPGNERPGTLETLFLEFIRSQENCNCIESFFSCLENSKFDIPSNKDKSFVQTYVSVHPVGVRLIGEAAQAGVWEFEHQAFSEVLQFLMMQSRLE